MEKPLPNIPPLITWSIALAALVVVGNVVANLFGLDFDFGAARDQGRLIVLFVAVAVALRFIGRAGRPYVDYGMVARPGWETMAFGLFISGIVFVLANLWAEHLSHGVEIDLRRGVFILASDMLSALLAATIAAYLQEICYRGFLFTELKRWIGSDLGAGLCTAAIFTATTDFSLERWTSLGDTWQTVLGAFVVGILLQLMRARHATLIAPISLITGLLFLDLLISRSAVDVTHAPGLPDLLILGGEQRTTTLFWVVVVIALGGYALSLTAFKPAEGRLEKPAPGADSLSKRVANLIYRYNPFSNLLMLARFDVWVVKLIQARAMIPPIYWPRLVFSLGGSLIFTVLNLPERLILPWLLRRKEVPPPVFIVGLHRSGTTLLHTLMSQDSRFESPTLAQVMNPDGFRWLGWLLFGLVMPLMPWQRPMDAMEFTAHAPQEDEFSIAMRSGLSPYWTFCFPRQHIDLDRFIYEDEMTEVERRRFVADLRILLVKMAGRKQKIALLKSPYHAARIAMLAEAFPGARFVHIRRDPTAVYRSTRITQDSFNTLFQLQHPRPGEDAADRLLDKHYLQIEGVCARAMAALPEGRAAWVSFESLTADPIKEVRRIRDELGLPFDDRAEAALVRHLADAPPHIRNVYPPMASDVAGQLAAKLAPLYRSGGYTPPSADQGALRDGLQD